MRWLGMVVALTASACAAPPQPTVPGRPVAPDPPAVEVHPTAALALVLDRSGSMMGEKLESTRKAAHGVVDSLHPDDYLAVIAFDSSATLVMPLSALADPGAAHTAIDSIQPGGGTSYGDALRLATEQLSNAQTTVRHVLFLTDGLAPTAGVDALVGDLTAKGATLSTIGLGKDIDPVLLGRMASRGRGGTWQVEDPSALETAFREDLARFLHH